MSSNCSPPRPATEKYVRTSRKRPCNAVAKSARRSQNERAFALDAQIHDAAFLLGLGDQSLGPQAVEQIKKRGGCGLILADACATSNLLRVTVDR